ncbi:hypothetical protein EDB83DRAFT_2326350 [Lactarius deliciosus]|nr:hypothetical protein EDB83DRAFT_2326350 [Lactarius deliciosus]
MFTAAGSVAIVSVVARFMVAGVVFAAVDHAVVVFAAAVSAAVAPAAVTFAAVTPATAVVVAVTPGDVALLLAKLLALWECFAFFRWCNVFFLDLRLKVEPLAETCKFWIDVLPARILASSCPSCSATGVLAPNGCKA